MAANTDPTPDPSTSPTGAPTGVNLGYAVDQLAQALVTATTHEDTDTRRRADRRMERWGAVLRGVLDGKLTIGSRTPVKDLPAWVTPGVVRGGFATGSAAAEGPLLPHEQALATRMRVAADRAELFRHHLSKHGLTELWTLLDTGARGRLRPGRRPGDHRRPGSAARQTPVRAPMTTGCCGGCRP
ncbi:hypothetical protein AB0H83_29380 [Dactylosporangium sp. NPDC050688]|uniref:hypothetical protein n=1 Tax=Dactylosporangium sp. NPDC050688 TaxID=3157217 RepID=UPI00341083FD